MKSTNWLELVNKVDKKCELCGSSRNIEVHHIIPRCCQIDGIDIDDKENLLVVCSSCHGKLTPKSMLSRYGIVKAKKKGKLLSEFYSIVESRIDENEGISPVEVMDIVDLVFGDAVCV